MSRNWQHQKMLNSRNKVVSTLPIEGSLVALDLVYFPVSCHNNNELASMKVLLTTLPHSPTGVRYHYRRLLNEGWIQTRGSNSDARVRFIEPTEKLLRVYFSLLDELVPLPVA